MRQQDPAHPGRPPDDPTTTGPVDLDEVQRFAMAADQSTYEAEAITDTLLSVPWDDETDQPISLWWVQRAGWIDNADAEALCYSEADARYAVATHPTTVLRLVAELRTAREAIETLRSWRPTSGSQQALLAAYDKAMGGERP